jgi:20S proteasome subunit alpha 6
MKVLQIVCGCSPSHTVVRSFKIVAGNLEDLIRHGLHALRETLQQDKELNVNNTSIGIIGPMGQHEKPISPPGSFRILEGEKVDVYLQSMVNKEEAAEPVPAPSADEDVQMSG